MLNGATLDDIVDYLTFVFVPAFVAASRGLLPAGSAGWVVVAAVLLSSAFGFSREDAKTADHFFTGFPSYWNIVAVTWWRCGLPPGPTRRSCWARRPGLRADRLRLPVADACRCAE